MMLLPSEKGCVRLLTLGEVANYCGVRPSVILALKKAEKFREKTHYFNIGTKKQLIIRYHPIKCRKAILPPVSQKVSQSKARR